MCTLLLCITFGSYDSLVDVRRQIEDVNAWVTEAIGEERGRRRRLRLRFDQLPETAVVELFVCVVQIISAATEQVQG